MAKVKRWGLIVEDTTVDAAIHLYFIFKGGQWESKKYPGHIVGKGLFFHYKAAIAEIWPSIKQHRWFDTFLENWIKHKYVGVLGPKNSGKTCGAAVFHLVDYYAFPSNTTVLVCSTTKEMLENRIWGEIKKLHRMAKQKYSWLPGNLIEGKQRIVTDDRDEATEGRDFRNGMMGIPLKKGGTYVGISDIIGIKNKRKRLCGDELQCLPKAFIDSTANFMEPGADCKVTGLGNPADTTDSLGVLCEPHTSLGGWEGGIDQTPKTKTWKTRFENGICVQLPGSDSPNNDVKPDEPIPFPFLMTRQQMEEDARTWGKEDWHYTMFNEGRMPRGQGSRRIITRQLCLRHRALEEPKWANPNRTKITFLDAAYRSVGGDRCVFGELDFGDEAFEPETAGEVDVSGLISQRKDNPERRQILALIDLMVIPIKPSDFESPEDQIVMFVKGQHEVRGIPPENHFYDAGMRTSLVTAYGRLWTPKVNSIDFGGKPTERRVSANIDVSCRDYYSKFVTELWFSVRLIVEAEQFRGMTEEVMLEGCAREWKTVMGNKIEVETKAEMKEKTGRSPDLFDALVAGVEGARQKGFQIRRFGSALRTKTDDRWKRELRDKAQSLWKQSQLNYAA